MSFHDIHRQTLVARIREVDAALRAHQPLRADGAPYPEVGDPDYTLALLRYDAQAVGALTTLALMAADELERRP